MDESYERRQQLLTSALAEIAGKPTRKQCFLLGFDKGVQAFVDEINQAGFQITKNRRDQMRRVAWNEFGGYSPKGNSRETFTLGFELGWKAANEEFAKQNQA